MKNWIVSKLDLVAAGALIIIVLGLAQCAHAFVQEVKVVSFAPGMTITVTGTMALSTTVFDVVVKGPITLSSSVYDAVVKGPITLSSSVYDVVVKGPVTVNLNSLSNFLPGATVYLMANDGTVWFGLLGDTANGLDVDVTRIQGLVQTSGSTFITNFPATNTVFSGSVTVTNFPATNTLFSGSVTVLNPSGTLISGSVTVTNTVSMQNGQGIVPWTVSPVGSENSCSSYSVSVGGTAVNLLPNQLAGGRHVGIRNTSLSDTLYVGDANVTTGGTGNGQAGYPIFPLESWTMDLTGGGGGKFYGRTTSATLDVRVTRW